MISSLTFRKIRAASSRPPRPNASPAAREIAPTNPINNVFTNDVAIPNCIKAASNPKIIIAHLMIVASNEALIIPAALVLPLTTEYMKFASKKAIDKMTVATRTLGMYIMI